MNTTDTREHTSTVSGSVALHRQICRVCINWCGVVHAWCATRGVAWWVHSGLPTHLMFVLRSYSLYALYWLRPVTAAGLSPLRPTV
jgi:hypothetical protein